MFFSRSWKRPHDSINVGKGGADGDMSQFSELLNGANYQIIHTLPSWHGSYLPFFPSCIAEPFPFEF